MLNFLWAALIIIGTLYGFISGNQTALSNGALDSAKDAVSLCITMLGVMSLWTGLMEIARQSGLITACQRRLFPVIHWLFPQIPDHHDSLQHITTNIIANVLGLGWAATPAGLKAMESLAQLEEARGHKSSPLAASNEMCTFLIINISSLQLIPVNIIAYRIQYGSVNPTAVIGPGLIATLISTIIAVIFCKFMTRKSP